MPIDVYETRTYLICVERSLIFLKTDIVQVQSIKMNEIWKSLLRDLLCELGKFLMLTVKISHKTIPKTVLY